MGRRVHVRRAMLSVGTLFLLLGAMAAKGGCSTAPSNPCMERAAYTSDETLAIPKCVGTWTYHVHITWKGISRVEIIAGPSQDTRNFTRTPDGSPYDHTFSAPAASMVIAHVLPDPDARIFNGADTDCTTTVRDERGHLIATVHPHPLPGGHKHPQSADCTYPE